MAKTSEKKSAPPASYTVVDVAVEDLLPATYNPRKATEKEFADVRASIEKFGIVDPIVANSHPGRENIVIGGHLRLAVAKAIGRTTVPVHYESLDEDRERELNLRLNKNVGSWDWDALANGFEIEVLRDVGFTDEEIGLSGDDALPTSSDRPTNATYSGTTVVFRVPAETWDVFRGEVETLKTRFAFDEVSVT